MEWAGYLGYVAVVITMIFLLPDHEKDPDREYPGSEIIAGLSD